MVRSNDPPPDPQHTSGAQANSPLDTDVLATEAPIDKTEEKMAQKAFKTEKSNETNDTAGGVRSNSGGIFSKY